MPSPNTERSGVLSAADILFLHRMRTNEAAADDEWVRVYLASIYRVACRMLRNRDEAAEVTVDAFIRLFQSVGEYEGESSSLRTWVFKVAFSEIRSPLGWVHRRCRRLIQPADDAPPSEDRRTRGWGLENRSRELDLGPSAAVAPQEMARERAVQAALEKLPRSRRSVVILRDIEGCSYEETAEILAISTDAVKRRLAKARAALTRDLSRYLSLGPIG
jgi:RNA polymerase sigma-70 factor (ECF subfamily)